jgi:hypothetical protein
MKRARDQLFTGAALARDEDRRLALGDRAYALEQPHHRRRLPDDRRPDVAAGELRPRLL